MPCACSRVNIDMAQFLPCTTWRRDEMVRVLVAKCLQRLLDPAQLDGTMRRQISALRGALGEVAARKECLCAVVVAGAKVCLCQPECVVIIVYTMRSAQVECDSWCSILVRAYSLSATNMAVSYWCRFKASCRQSRRYFSMIDLSCTRMGVSMPLRMRKRGVVKCSCCGVDKSRRPNNAKACELELCGVTQGNRLSQPQYQKFRHHLQLFLTPPIQSTVNLFASAHTLDIETYG